MQVNMGYRRWLSPSFSSALAFYSSYSMGEPAILFNNISPGNEVGTSARDITEYGFDFSFRAELWTDKKMSVFLDTRYSLSMTSKSHESADHYGVLFGVSYLVQQKHPDKDLPPVKNTPR